MRSINLDNVHVEYPKDIGAAQGTGRPLLQPCSFADGPKTWRRLQDSHIIREVLARSLQGKWKESTSGPPHPLPDVLSGGDDSLRENLRLEQGRCPELKLRIAAFAKLAVAGSKDKVVEEVQQTEDYRLHPVDGVLERQVIVGRVHMYVPVMPTTVVPPEFFGVATEGLS